jgi:peptidoglycan/xylan/chitin deacetylase (PgdA/CDA1 family)
MPSPNSIPERIDHKLARVFPIRRMDLVPSRPIVSFTFDDVPVSALTNGARILERHGVRGTFYVAGGIAGRQHDGQPMLSAEDYRSLSAAGHEIGHHTFSHRTAWSLGFGYGADLERNGGYLGDILPAPARNFAFPFGRATLGGRDAIRRRFRSARGAENGINRAGSDLDLLHAVGIESHMRIEGLQHWIDDAVKSPGWLIFLTHDVQEAPSPFGTTPAILDALIAHAVAKGCDVLTVDAALDALGVSK